MNKEVLIDAIMTAFEASYDGLHILDANGDTLYINSACTRIEGISKEEALNKNIRELVADGTYSESATLKVLETKQPTTIIQKAKNGNMLLSTGTPVYSADGEIDKVVINSRDITDLNNLKRELTIKEAEIERLRNEQMQFSDIIAKSVSMQKILNMALTVAKVDSTVMITGESGVGKGLLAKFIHTSSNRNKGPFIKIDCSSIPESLIESELFGYEKGAFTGANREGKVGLLEMGDGGTVFLDEVGEMPISMQPKLLRAIQDREIIPVGGGNVRKLDVRFISATNVDIEKMVEDKLFREDLYYRLQVVPIDIPPLRERREDILPLIRHVVNEINKKYKLSKELSADVYMALLKYEWPGNVRQLENFIERILVSTANDVIEIIDLGSEILAKKSDSELKIDLDDKTYKELIAEYDNKIINLVVEAEGSIPKAAKKLEIDATTLRRKLEKYSKTCKNA